MSGNMHVRFEVRSFNRFKLVWLTGPLRAGTQTDRQTHIERKQYLRHSLRSVGGDNKRGKLKQKENHWAKGDSHRRAGHGHHANRRHYVVSNSAAFGKCKRYYARNDFSVVDSVRNSLNCSVVCFSALNRDKVPDERICTVPSAIQALLAPQQQPTDLSCSTSTLKSQRHGTPSCILYGVDRNLRVHVCLYWSYSVVRITTEIENDCYLGYAYSSQKICQKP